MKTSLGDRMKTYEQVARTGLMRRTPVIIRLDGKAFHTFTRRMKRPWDERLHACMWSAAQVLCQEVQGCKLAYVQSDEISLLLTDWEMFNTEAWFGNQVQKMVSVAASVCTAAFARAHLEEFWTDELWMDGEMPRFPAFDARCFNLPKEEVANYFLWRQQDATRNSLTMLAQAHFSHKQLHCKDGNAKQDMLMSLDPPVNWNDCPVPQKRGVCVVKEFYVLPAEAGAIRSRWAVDESIPIFSKDRDYIEKHLCGGEE
ncbi:MAG: tRNA(His) guanylyltransferase Thg1 family protein [Gemmatimonadota bacterium]